MALTLAIPLGTTVMIGERPLSVARVTDLDNFTVRFDGAIHTITDKGWTVLAEGVEMIAMTWRAGPKQFTLRARIEAPAYKIYRVKQKGERL